MSKNLQKLVQEKLAQCRKLLDECVEHAEEGQFEFAFNPPGNRYYPSNMYTDAEAVEYLEETEGTDWEVDLTPEERAEAIVEARAQLKYENLPEYAELGSWWMPSRNC